MPDAAPTLTPVVDDLVIILGRVHAVPVESGLMPVELASGGFVWLMPTECEQIPAAEVARGLE